jgi:hypothetical protein
VNTHSLPGFGFTSLIADVVLFSESSGQGETNGGDYGAADVKIPFIGGEALQT